MKIVKVEIIKDNDNVFNSNTDIIGKIGYLQEYKVIQNRLYAIVIMEEGSIEVLSPNVLKVVSITCYI